MIRNLISVKRRGFPEEIHEATYDSEGNIKSSKKVNLEKYDHDVLDAMKIAEKYTIEHKSEIFSAVLLLREKESIRKAWPGIESAIEDFNDEVFIRESVPHWKPTNAKGRGEAQFHLMFKSDQKIEEPDFCASQEEGYSIKFFGNNGKKSVLSGEFINKDKSGLLESPIREIMKALQIPNELRTSGWLPGEIGKIRNEYLEKCIEFAPYDDWSKIKLTSGISKADIQNLIDDYKKVCDELQIENYEESLKFLISHIRKNLKELKFYLIHESPIQKGIIAIKKDLAILIDDEKFLRINYIRPNLRVSFSAIFDEKETSNSSIEDLL